MKIKDVCKCLVSDMVITFDEDPYHNCKPDIIIPVSAEPTDILAEGVLELEVHLMGIRDDQLWVTTNTRF